MGDVQLYRVSLRRDMAEAMWPHHEPEDIAAAMNEPLEFIQACLDGNDLDDLMFLHEKLHYEDPRDRLDQANWEAEMAWMACLDEAERLGWSYGKTGWDLEPAIQHRAHELRRFAGYQDYDGDGQYTGFGLMGEPDTEYYILVEMFEAGWDGGREELEDEMNEARRGA